MKKIVVLVSLMALVLQAQETIKPNGDKATTGHDHFSVQSLTSMGYSTNEASNIAADIAKMKERYDANGEAFDKALAASADKAKFKASYEANIKEWFKAHNLEVDYSMSFILVDFPKLLAKTMSDVSDKKQSSTLEVDNVILDFFTSSKQEMAGMLFTGGKIITPTLGHIYRYDGHGLTVVQSTSEGYLVTGAGDSFIVVKASKIFLDRSLSFATGATYLKGGLFKYIGEKEFEFTSDLVETRKLYCFEAVDNSQGSNRGESIVTNSPAAVTNQFIGKSLTRDEISRCVNLVRNALYVAWDQPKESETGLRRAKLYIRLDGSGRITTYRITESSGNSVFDMTVLKAAANCPAIRGLSVPFLKEHDELTIEFKLE